MKPMVAIVGRPNVGKSTFFNRILGKRMSIVEDVPGVTRDRIYGDAEWLGRHFTLVDTGGIDPDSEDVLFSHMRRQAEIAIEMADVILFFVDGREGLVSLDHDVAHLLRQTRKPVLLVINKVDAKIASFSTADYYELGMGEPYVISSVNALGIGDLLDGILAYFPDLPIEDEKDGQVHIAVVGRPNVGKSSLVNRLLREERCIVSDIPGTTRDALDTLFTVNGQPYVIIDTAGIRKKAKIEDTTIERYSVIRSLMAIRRCDVALMIIDAVQGVTEQDTKIAGYIHEEGKACVIVVNKWDLVEKETNTMEQMRRRIRSDLIFMDYAPIVFLSALTGQRVHQVMEQVDSVYAQAAHRVPTGVLNDVLHDATTTNEPPYSHGRQLKIYYITQASVFPPTFVLFVNDEKRMHFSYQRYLENQLRRAFGFEGTPVRFILRNKKDGEAIHK